MKRALPTGDVKDLTEAVTLLADHPFILHRVAPTTYHKDISGNRPGHPTENALTGNLIRSGLAYRARIAGGPYFCATTASAAAQLALNHLKTK